jgi:hypothetical protein
MLQRKRISSFGKFLNKRQPRFYKSRAKDWGTKVITIFTKAKYGGYGYVFPKENSSFLFNYFFLLL